MNDLYLGHTAQYWLELEKRADTLAVTDFLQEIADLRGQLDFVKSRVRQINDVVKP